MKRIIWLTDLHLNAAQPPLVDALLHQIKVENPEALLIAGDVADGTGFIKYLPRLAEQLTGPVYFVLGNHDFYGGSIATNRALADELARRHPQLIYLTTATAPIALTPTTALIGHDGWSDGQSGDFLNSDVLLNDFVLIDELNGLPPTALLEKLRALGQEGANHLKQQLEMALQTHSHVIAVTHPPPTREGARYNGNTADDSWAPHFVSQAIGDTLAPVMLEHPEKQLTLYCGHAHHGAEVEILPNFHSTTGRTKVGIPRIQQVLEVS